MNTALGTLPILATLIALLVPPLLSGCLWLPMNDWQHAVWSDDGEGVAFVQRSFEGQNLIDFNRGPNTSERDHEFEIYTSSLSSPDNSTQLAGPFTGNLVGLYFMASAGYLVAGRATTPSPYEGDEAPATESYDLIDLDGTVTSIAAVDYLWHGLQCEDEGVWLQNDGVVDVIPSPDGSILARLVAGLTCEDTLPVQSVTLSFLEAPGLQAIGEPLFIDTGVLPEGNECCVRSGWLADGSFAITGLGWEFPDREQEGWLIEPGGEPVWGALPGEDCLEPPTTSSVFRADGMRVWIDGDGTLGFEDEEDNPEVFGCDTR